MLGGGEVIGTPSIFFFYNVLNVFSDAFGFDGENEMLNPINVKCMHIFAETRSYSFHLRVTIVLIELRSLRAKHHQQHAETLEKKNEELTGTILMSLHRVNRWLARDFIVSCVHLFLVFDVFEQIPAIGHELWLVIQILAASSFF